VVACTMGSGITKEIRTYTTMTNDLLRLKGWLKEAAITPLREAG
jgi:transposase